MYRPLLCLFCSLVLYFTLSYVSMVNVVAYPYVHDFFTFPKSETLVIISNIIPFVSVLYRITVTPFPKWSLYLYRISMMYLLKGLIQFVTIVPSVDGVTPCVNRTVLQMILLGNCSDMMFSGHTGITLLTSPHKFRFFISTVIGIALVAGHQHYTSDVVISVIVVYWIEIIFPEKKHNYDILG